MNRRTHSFARAFMEVLLAVGLLFVASDSVKAQAPPRVQSFTVDDGTTQRSMVRSVTIQFSSDVSASLTTDDLDLAFLDKGDVIKTAVTYQAATNRATWTFPNQVGSSLPDGTFDFTLKAAGVFDASGRTLDGNGDGTGGDDYVVRIHRFFGDYDGDRDVDYFDTAHIQKAFATSVAGPVTDPVELARIRAFDYNNDSKVDTVDVTAFEKNYLKVLQLTILPRFRAIADCSPTSGAVPLTVKFVSRAEFPGGSIVRYRWDFQGDGTFDTSDPVAVDYTRTFTTTGTFNAVLEVTNNFGNTARDTCPITVTGSPPTVTANALPSNGPAPLLVTLSATAADTDGTIVKYEWDFEGDGVFDFSSPTQPSVVHTYPTPGQFTAICRVTDNSGLTATARTTTTAIDIGTTGSPSILASANASTTRASGNAPFAVNFTATISSGGPIVKWEWDFDGNGTYDFTSTTTPVASFTYTQAGIFAPRVRATNGANLSSTDTVEVESRVTPTLTIPNDTFDPTAGQTAAVNTTLNGAVPVRLLIKDKGGSIVRILADAARAAGNYSDPWDGRNDSGNLLPQAPYYVVLEYKFAGETRTIDLTTTTGGTRYNPARTPIPATFKPFDDNLLAISFTVPTSQGASEIQAFMGLFNTDTRFVTFLDRIPFGVGTHTIFWDGRDANGNAAVPPPGDSFLFGIFGFRLPDNAIFIQSAPVISNVTATPNFFDPSTGSFLTPANPTATFTFDLNKLANITLSVTNLPTGKVLRTITNLNVTAGTGRQIKWDGHADNGLFADRGDYRISIQATDSTGSASIVRYALVRVFY